MPAVVYSTSANLFDGHTQSLLVASYVAPSVHVVHAVRSRHEGAAPQDTHAFGEVSGAAKPGAQMQGTVRLPVATWSVAQEEQVRLVVSKKEVGDAQVDEDSGVKDD